MGKNGSKLKPKTIKDLKNQTDFSGPELQQWYKSFVKDYPEGTINKEEFRKTYEKVFPDGDATSFSDQVFRTFDKNVDNKVDFRELAIAMSVILRGTQDEKLKWAFSMYDLDGNGYITKDEMLEIVKAINKMAGSEDGNVSNESTSPEDHVDKIFKELEKNDDGKLSLEEFVEGARKDPAIVSMLSDPKPQS